MTPSALLAGYAVTQRARAARHGLTPTETIIDLTRAQLLDGLPVPAANVREAFLLATGGAG